MGVSVPARSAWGTVSWLIRPHPCLTGQLDREGGVMFPRAAALAANTQSARPRQPSVQSGRRQSRTSGAPEVMGELPMTCLAEEIETPGPGQVRALITVASNPCCRPRQRAARRSAGASSTSCSASTSASSETTRHADVILPGSRRWRTCTSTPPLPSSATRSHARVSGPVFRACTSRPSGRPTCCASLRLALEGKGRGGRAHRRAPCWPADLARSAGPEPRP